MALLLRHSGHPGSLGQVQNLNPDTLLEVEQRPSIEAIAEKLIAAITEPLAWKEHPLQLGVSIGIAVYPDTATDAESLMGSADRAMYDIKRKSKNSWAFAGDE